MTVACPCPSRHTCPGPQIKRHCATLDTRPQACNVCTHVAADAASAPRPPWASSGHKGPRGWCGVSAWWWLIGHSRLQSTRPPAKTAAFLSNALRVTARQAPRQQMGNADTPPSQSWPTSRQRGRSNQPAGPCTFSWVGKGGPRLRPQRERATYDMASIHASQAASESAAGLSWVPQVTCAHRPSRSRG